MVRQVRMAELCRLLVVCGLNIRGASGAVTVLLWALGWGWLVWVGVCGPFVSCFGGGRSASFLMPSCLARLQPPTATFNGCVPCPQAPAGASELATAAFDSRCIKCLLESREPFLIGRPGMGAPEEVSCALATHERGFGNNSAAFFARERATLKTLNGVLTTDEADARHYAQCYWAAVNGSDLIVRLGGGHVFPLRQPTTICTKPGSKHFHKVDVLLAQSGHFPSRVLSPFALNPWMLIANAQCVSAGLDPLSHGRYYSFLLACNQPGSISALLSTCTCR